VLSVFDLFRVGLGPSSSHTVGPMRAARAFAEALDAAGRLGEVASLRCELYGSLAATGRAHGTDTALVLGLEGERPELVDPDGVPARLAAVRAGGRIGLLGRVPVPFSAERDLVWHRRESLPAHPNGMRFSAWDDAGEVLLVEERYSVGGGFVATAEELAGRVPRPAGPPVPFPFSSGEGLLAHCTTSGLGVSGVMLANELVRRDEHEIRAGLLRLWSVMRQSVQRGCTRPGQLPGFLRVRRRAPELAARLGLDTSFAPLAGGNAGSTGTPGGADAALAAPAAAYAVPRARAAAASSTSARDSLAVLDAVDLFALAVSEENAAGGRIVTAPTNGAAGIVPAALEYYARFVEGASEDGVVRFLLAAGAVALLCKQNASISGAEVGCQGEVGSACAMAAAGLAEALGGTPAQVENAAEIGIEHNLGLTCDPVGGLVQVPCIERNAMGAVKALNAARLALAGDGRHVVSLDKVLATMRRTGEDMHSKYKETSRGGLAVSITEC
jgi:L-serine dehydratase